MNLSSWRLSHEFLRVCLLRAATFDEYPILEESKSEYLQTVAAGGIGFHIRTPREAHAATSRQVGEFDKCNATSLKPERLKRGRKLSFEPLSHLVLTCSHANSSEDKLPMLSRRAAPTICPHDQPARLKASSSR